MFANLAHYFEWCSLLEKQWRVRVRINPKTAKAERSLAVFHAKYPSHVVSLAQWRINRARRRQTTSGASSTGALGVDGAKDSTHGARR